MLTWTMSKDAPPPKDGKPFWAFLFQNGIQPMRFESAAEYARRRGSDPSEYLDAYITLDEEDEFDPVAWAPFDAISLPPGFDITNVSKVTL